MSDRNYRENRILVIGAGELGMAVLRELQTLHDHGRVPSVSVLLRPLRGESVRVKGDQCASLRTLGVEIVEADLATASVADLTAIFARFAVVVCCTGFVGGAATQRKITAAVLAAEVEHYIPWQFGVDYDVIGCGSGQEVWDEQLDVRDLLRSQQRVGWTIVSTGMFTSFVFLPAFGLVDLERDRVHALGSWDFQLTVTTPEDIGRLTALVVESRSTLRNEIVYVAGDTFTYRELADTVETVLARPVERRLWTSAELKADVAAHPEDMMRKYRLAFARAAGVAWPKDRTFNAERGIAVTDLATWLTQQRDAGHIPASHVMRTPVEHVAAPDR